MPFKSEKQRRYLWLNHPEIAKKWSDKYGSSVSKGISTAAKDRISKKTPPVGKKRGRS